MGWTHYIAGLEGTRLDNWKKKREKRIKMNKKRGPKGVTPRDGPKNWFFGIRIVKMFIVTKLGKCIIIRRTSAARRSPSRLGVFKKKGLYNTLVKEFWLFMTMYENERMSSKWKDLAV